MWVDQVRRYLGQGLKEISFGESISQQCSTYFCKYCLFVAFGRTGGKYGKETEDYETRLEEALEQSEKHETEKIIHLLVLMTEKAERQAMHARGTMAALWAILAYVVVDGMH